MALYELDGRVSILDSCYIFLCVHISSWTKAEYRGNFKDGSIELTTVLVVSKMVLRFPPCFITEGNTLVFYFYL